MLILWLMSFWRDYACAMMQRHVQVGKAERQRGRLGLMHQPQLQHAVTGHRKARGQQCADTQPRPALLAQGSTAEAVSFSLVYATPSCPCHTLVIASILSYPFYACHPVKLPEHECCRADEIVF